MKRVLFFSATYYDLPLSDNLKKKFQFLSEVSECTVVAFSNKNIEFQEENTNFYIYKQSSFRILNYLKILKKSYFDLNKIIKKQNIDIVAFQDPITSFLGFLRIKQSHPNIKIVLESHGDFINTLGMEKNLLLPSLYKKAFNSIAQYTIDNADIVRAVSSSTEEQVLSFNKSKNVVRFPAWIDFEVYKNVAPTREDNLIYKILFIGSVTDRKKPHMVIEALPKLNNKNVEFHIVGPTPNQQYLERIYNLIDEYNLEDKVFIHGIKDRDEVIEFYKTSNLMILPSVSEGLARVIFESQVTSCPVLVTDAPGMQDIVIDGQTGFVFESNNLESLVLKMNEVFDDYNQSIQIGRNAKDFILENFSEDKFKFSFKKIFDLV